MKPKRLFLIAGYDKDGIIDESLIHQVSSLSKLGDAILVMDSDCDETQLDKVKPFVIFASGNRHKEYDFGSYKRAYLYAKEHDLLKNYDYLYLVNDSVYGPLYDLQPYLEKMENSKKDAFGLVYNPHKKHPHIQSWFIGMTQKVFLSNWFDDFLVSVKEQQNKSAIYSLYEHGFTKKSKENNLSIYYIYSIKRRGIYNKVKYLYKKKLPFIKKNAFIRQKGSLGKQIMYVLNHTNPKLRKIILQNAKRVYGEKYIYWLLTKNPIKIIYRNLKHIFIKLFIEGI